MKKRDTIIFAVILVLLLASCAKDAYVEDATVKGTVSILASEEFRGRLAGTEGNSKTLEYMADRFEKMGLEAFGDSGYFHEYTQTVYDPDKQQYSFAINYEDGSSKKCVYGVDYTINLYTDDFDITYPLTYDTTDSKLDEKIVVLDEDGDLKEVRDAAKGIMVKRKEFFRTAAASNSTSPLVSVSEKLYEELKDKRIRAINVKSKYTAEEKTERNVIGKITGNNSKKALVLSAHIDHVGWAGESIYYGAVDNASGAAVMLDIAEKLADSAKKKKLGMDILICGFNGEEYGLEGSRAFAGMIKGRYDEIYNVNIDCVGKKDGGRIALDNTSGVDSRLLDGIKETLTKHQLESVDKYYGMSDHQSFIDNNMCGITIGQEELSSGNRIHTKKDTTDNIDYAYLERVSAAVSDFIMSNDGNVYKLNGRNNSNGGDGEISQATWDKINQRAKELREQKTLKYDEIVAFELDGHVCQISGNHALTDKNEINRYYPGMQISEKLMSYVFDSMYINDMDTGTQVYNDKSFYDKELDKVYKRELKPEYINQVSIGYRKNDRNLQIIIKKSYKYKNGKYFKLDLCDTEEVEVEGNKYIILKTKGREDIQGIYREYGLNGKKYDVEISLYSNVKSKVGSKEINTRQYDGMREEMTDAAKNIDIEGIVKGLGLVE